MRSPADTGRRSRIAARYAIPRRHRAAVPDRAARRFRADTGRRSRASRTMSSMLYDKARIHVQAGRGGNGSASFRREAHVPRGGPDGGDGGHGGDVTVECDGSLRDLQAFRRRTHYRAAARRRRWRLAAPRGQRGAVGAARPARHARVVRPDDGDAPRPRFAPASDKAFAARGGSGGRGNKHFATPTRQSPRFAERGLAGEEHWLELTLKLLADVGLVGLPNAGKSTLLSRLTRAHPKVAAYPFTTLEPVLGTLDRADRQLVIADIPGLIEGASEGAGLGHEFLAHVERTRLLVHVLDLAPLDGSDPLANHATIERELESHDPRLAALPRVLALSKADLVDAAVAQRAASAWRTRLAGGTPVIVTSSATGTGLGELADELLRRVPLEEPIELADAAGGRAGRAPHLPPGGRARLSHRAHRRRCLPRRRRGDRPAARPPRPRQRRGARARRVAAASDRRDPGSAGPGLRGG